MRVDGCWVPAEDGAPSTPIDTYMEAHPNGYRAVEVIDVLLLPWGQRPKLVVTAYENGMWGARLGTRGE